MTDPSLVEHLIKDFQEQKATLKAQIELIDPIAASIRKPAATRLFHSGSLILLEFIMWILALFSIAFILFFDKLAPFFYLSQIANDSTVLEKYQQQDLITLAWYIKGLIVVLVLAFIWIARMLSKIRLKNSILNITGKSLKHVVEGLLQRKAAMENLELKYPVALPADADSIILPIDNQGHNDVLL